MVPGLLDCTQAVSLPLPVLSVSLQSIAQRQQFLLIGHEPQPFLDPLSASFEGAIALILSGLFQQAGSLLIIFDLLAQGQKPVIVWRSLEP